MNHTRKDSVSQSQAEDDVRRLLIQAGPRPDVPAAHLASLKTIARTELLKLAHRAPAKGRPRMALPLLAAAVLVLAIGATLFWVGSSAPPAPRVATVELIRGDVWLEQADDVFVLGGSLAAGTELVTGSGSGGTPDLVAVRLVGGQSVRVDRGSRLRLADAERLELVRGAVYVDSGSADRGLEIVTRFGSVIDVGTQFEVRLPDDGDKPLVVRVRRGAVSLSSESRRPVAASAGEELAVTTEGNIERSPLSSTDPVWRWILAAAPGFAIEGRTLGEFLDWVENETGWSVEFSPPETADRSVAIELHGTIEGLPPDQAVDAVLPGCGLDYDLTDGVLSIGPATIGGG